jgi:mRNA-degrading endonuclease RelE of RelBE toxin-antitoxin system
MRFDIYFTTDAELDLGALKVREQRIVVAGSNTHLTHDADQENRRRKRLQPNALAPWELRIEKYRVFYEIEDPGVVWITAVGVKEHNELYIRGQRVDL